MLSELHKNAIARKEFKFHNPATNIFIYVYQDEWMAENYHVSGGYWIGMSSKSFKGTTSDMNIASKRLTNLREAPKTVGGVQEEDRKEKFRKNLLNGHKANEVSNKEFPNIDDWGKQYDRRNELVAEYEKELMQSYDITKDQLREIVSEGKQKY